MSIIYTIAFFALTILAGLAVSTNMTDLNRYVAKDLPSMAGFAEYILVMPFCTIIMLHFMYVEGYLKTVDYQAMFIMLAINAALFIPLRLWNAYRIQKMKKLHQAYIDSLPVQLPLY